MTQRTVHGIDLTQPDGIARLLEFHRARWGTATMTAPVTTETTTTEVKPEVEQTTTETTSTTTESEAKFTQKDLDRIIGERVAAEKTKADQRIAEAQQLAGKNETEKLTIERDQAQQRATEATKAAAQRIAKTEAKGVARDLDARPDRLDAILRQADLSKAVNDDGEVDEPAVKAAVEKVLADYPEWKKGPGGPTSSGGELNGGGGSGKPTFTRKQLEDMPPQEMASRIDEINEAIADGRVTG